MDFDHTLLHSDLSGLEVLKNFSFESKMLISQQFSSRIMNGSEVDMSLAYSENIMPWELEIFTAYSVIFDDKDAFEKIDYETFARTITYIRNYWDTKWNEVEEDGTYPHAFMMRATIQQIPVQGLILQKLYRYNYIFNFQNDILNMKNVFSSKFGTNYLDFEFTAFATFLLLSKVSNDKTNPYLRQKALCKLFSNKPVMSVLCIDKTNYVNEMRKLYKDDLIKLYYGLKAHYWWPFIEGTDSIYIPSPFLVINAVTDSMLNRLTLGDDKLRRQIGKEILEQYLFDIYSQVSTVSWASKEIEYYVGRNLLLSPDVIIAENEYCCFFDTKEMVPSLKIRELDSEEIQNDIEIYAEAVKQIYTQIINCIKGHFKLDKEYEKNKIFGVIIMLEDIALSRQEMYDKSIELIRAQYSELNEEEKQYIRSHIKIVSLRQIELMVLQNSSFLPCLLKQENDPDHWNDLNFVIPTTDNGLIDSYQLYCDTMKKNFYSFVKKL